MGAAFEGAPRARSDEGEVRNGSSIERSGDLHGDGRRLARRLVIFGPPRTWPLRSASFPARVAADRFTDTASGQPSPVLARRPSGCPPGPLAPHPALRDTARAMSQENVELVRRGIQ